MIIDVASEQNAHVMAYKAAMATLFKLEMEAITLDPSKAGGKMQHKAAFAAVNTKIGQPPHKVDWKYHIKASLLSIELHLMLSQVASTRVAELSITSKEPDHPQHQKIWTTFIGFLYDSCIKDCMKTISLACSCFATRQEAQVSMVNLYCNFERIQFDALEQCHKIQILSKCGDVQLCMRVSLGTLISEQRAMALQELLDVRRRYLQNQPVNLQEEMNEEILWFKENCSSRAEKIFATYQDLQEHILKAEVFYKLVSLQEKQDIVKALSFGMLHVISKSWLQATPFCRALKCSVAF